MSKESFYGTEQAVSLGFRSFSIPTQCLSRNENEKILRIIFLQFLWPFLRAERYIRYYKVYLCFTFRMPFTSSKEKSVNM